MVSTKIATISEHDLGGQALPHVVPEGKPHRFLLSTDLRWGYRSVTTGQPPRNTREK